VKFTVDEAEKRDITCDIIVGTGWPFGGEFLEPGEWIQGVELEVIQAEGPAKLEHTLENRPDENHRLMQVNLVPRPAHSLQDITRVEAVPDSDGKIEIEVPAGSYDVHVVTWRRRFRDVKFGAPGGAGPVLDHFNEGAVRNYLSRMSNGLNPHFQGRIGDSVRSMFCDSIELEGANWTDDFSEEFERRRGYSIEPYLALVMNRDAGLSEELSQTIRRVRFDHSLTLSELYTERFLKVYHEWCHSIGTESRYQSYGYPWIYTDLLQGYLLPDIPEGDQWLFNSGWMSDVEIDEIRYAVWNKYASSGANLAGRKIASSEAMTNNSGVFQASLEYVKQATDIDFITGINHLVLHGFNYSPEQAGVPGWVRLGTYFNENNPWWKHMPLWSGYTARLSHLFQKASPVSQVAILGPTLDVWSDFGLDRNPLIVRPGYLHELWQAVNHHGYMSDYVNPSILERASFKDGKIHSGQMSYDVLIVSSVQTMRVETARALRMFVEAGGRILFIENEPSMAPGLMNRDSRDAEVQAVLQELHGQHGDRVKFTSAPPEDDLTAWIGEQLAGLSVKPSVRITPSDERLFVLHKTHDKKDIFFFVNTTRTRTIDFAAQFGELEGIPWRWDAAKGKREIFAENFTGELAIQLKPLESLLLVFDEPKESCGSIYVKKTLDRENVLQIQGPWRVEFHPVVGRNRLKFMNRLVDFAQQDDLMNFSGEIVYHTGFTLQSTKPLILDLGEVRETAEVIFNGQNLGVQYWGERHFDLTDVLREGENDLVVKVTTLLFNYIRSMEHSSVAEYWVKRSGREEPLPTGLIGPVNLIPVRS
ncbi:MAG: hypothetical protein GF372_07305, partial [Candidatus Marinimicrobia bacterium]|nr:hypothetical protein [Candidatus Neomarinimicrobiota bacterium]